MGGERSRKGRRRPSTELSELSPPTREASGRGLTTRDLGDPSLVPSLNVDPIADWLLRGSNVESSAEDLLDGVAQRLLDEDVPVFRVSMNVHTLHPEVAVRNLVWSRDAGTSSTMISHFDLSLPIFRESPVAAIYNGSSPIRRRLDAPPFDFPICEELAAEGATDYLILPLPLGDGTRTYCSFTSRKAGGFSDDEVLRLVNLAPFLGQRLELESSYFATESLLQLYLGRQAAARVLEGNFQRGKGELLNAAIWYCDLRSFTSLTSKLGPARTVELLDRYFEVVANSVTQHGGEILKFIGDAVLAVFTTSTRSEEESCSAALTAARDVQAALSYLDTESGGLKVGIALHEGGVLFGNVGGHMRLDFTVIGPAVNEVCRMESLCKDLGVDILLSDQFVASLPSGIAVQPKGSHQLRGVDRPLEVFALEDE